MYMIRLLFEQALQAHQQNNFESAKIYYKKIIQLQPHHVLTLNNLGAIAIKENQIDQAKDYFKKALAIEPKHKEARSNLAAVFLQQEEWKESSWHYYLYLQLMPEDSEAHYNCGVATMAIGQLQEAIQHFEKTLSIVPYHLNASCNLAAIYLIMNRRVLAIATYQHIIMQQANHPIACYMLSALTGYPVSPPAAPVEYIKNLFDNYAASFDKHLVNVLHYQLPQLLFHISSPYLSENLTILDLGCGTGLSGVMFREKAKTLIGVDLSPRMLFKAKEKNIYDKLIEANLIDALRDSNDYYDLIIAADTLTYVGDLNTIFAAAYSALKQQGLFIFSVEMSKLNHEYTLQTTGRYQHSTLYIKKLATRYFFKRLLSKKISGRKQDQQAVTHSIFILKKKKM